MSQSNSRIRPAFWKVPDYIRDPGITGHRLSGQWGGNSNSSGVGYQCSKQPSRGLLKTSTPHSRRGSCQKRVRFNDEPLVAVAHDEVDYARRPQQHLLPNRVQVGSPAFGEVLRGDVISKIGEYDARDLSHADAQTLFRTAGNEIRIVVHRDSKIAYTQGLSGDNSRPNSSLLSNSPDPFQPHRAPSPFLPGPGQYEHALQVPVDTLPHTVFPKLNASGGYVAPTTGSFMPMPTRDHQQDVAEEQAAIVNQPYRTTPPQCKQAEAAAVASISVACLSPVQGHWLLHHL